MKFDYTKLSLIICAFFLLLGCTEDSKKDVPPVKNPVQVKLIRLEKQLFALKSKEETKDFLIKTPAFSHLYLDAPDSLIDDRMASFIFEFYQEPTLREFYRYTDSSFN